MRENVNVDPQLLFQRLVMAAGFWSRCCTEKTLKNLPLSTYPSALFEPNGLIRETYKPSLINDATWNSAKRYWNASTIKQRTENVLDGDYLCLKMPHLISYEEAYLFLARLGGLFTCLHLLTNSVLMLSISVEVLWLKISSFSSTHKLHCPDCLLSVFYSFIICHFISKSFFFFFFKVSSRISIVPYPSHIWYV